MMQYVLAVLILLLVVGDSHRDTYVPHTEVWPMAGGTLTVYDDARGNRTETFTPVDVAMR